MVQTGKNLPPDQNTPTGMPDEMTQSVQGNPEGVGEEMLPEGVGTNGADVAEPANPIFDLGDESGSV